MLLYLPCYSIFMNDSLAQKKCVACEGGTAPLSRVEAEVLLKQVQGWTLSGEGTAISKTFTFRNFKDSLAYAGKIGAIAEEEGHHPDLHVSWGKLVVELSTHAIGGLSENDFIMAAKVDQLQK